MAALLNGFIIFHFQINTEGSLNNLNQTLLKNIFSQLKEMFAKYVPAEEVAYCVRNDSRRWWTIRTSRRLF